MVQIICGVVALITIILGISSGTKHDNNGPVNNQTISITKNQEPNENINNANGLQNPSVTNTKNQNITQNNNSVENNKPANLPKPPPKGSVALFLNDILAGGASFELAIKIISLVDKSMASTSQELLDAVNKDPSLCAYYMKIDGMPKYTDFFKNSAVINGCIIFGKYSISRTVLAMKKAARSSASSQEMDKSMQDLTPDEIQKISDDFKATKGKLDDESKAELKKCLVYLAYSSSSLIKVVQTAQALINTAQDIAKSIQSDFIGMNALKIPQVAGGVKGSVENLTNGVKETPDLIKNITVLISALTAVLGN